MARSRYLTRITNPTVLGSLEPNRLDRLLRPHAAFLATHGAPLPDDPELLDLDLLTRVLLAQHDDTPFDLVDALTHIDEMATDAGMERLERAAARSGIVFNGSPDRSPADLALELWLVAPRLLRDQHAVHVIHRQRSRHSFAPDVGAPRLRADLVAAHAMIEARVREFYVSRGRGDGASVVLFEDNADELRIAIQHGGPYARHACLKGSRPSTAHFRPLEFVSVTLNWSRCELSLSSSDRHEIDFLRRLIGEAVFGQAAFFADDNRYTLQPLRFGRSCIRWAGVPGIRSVRVELIELAKGGVHNRVDIIRADDAIAALEEDGEAIPASAEPVAARFVFEFTDSRKERSVLLRAGNRAAYTRDPDSAIVEAFFLANGFMREVTGGSAMATA